MLLGKHGGVMKTGPFIGILIGMVLISSLAGVLNSAILEGFFSTLFDESSIKKSNHVEEIYKKCAEENNCEFIDLNKHVKTSQKDGLHFDESEHKIIFEIVKKTISKWY